MECHDNIWHENIKNLHKDTYSEAKQNIPKLAN